MCLNDSLPEGFAIMLAQLLEDHCPGGRIHTHSKRLRAEEHSDQALAKQQLHNLLDDWQKPCTNSQAGHGKAQH